MNLGDLTNLEQILGTIAVRFRWSMSLVRFGKTPTRDYVGLPVSSSSSPAASFATSSLGG